jgi:hypothetical protein
MTGRLVLSRTASTNDGFEGSGDLELGGFLGGTEHCLHSDLRPGARLASSGRVTISFTPEAADCGLRATVTVTSTAIAGSWCLLSMNGCDVSGPLRGARPTR